jgi:hypothetical protein
VSTPPNDSKMEPGREPGREAHTTMDKNYNTHGYNLGPTQNSIHKHTTPNTMSINVKPDRHPQFVQANKSKTINDINNDLSSTAATFFQSLKQNIAPSKSSISSALSTIQSVIQKLRDLDWQMSSYNPKHESAIKFANKRPYLQKPRDTLLIGDNILTTIKRHHINQQCQIQTITSGNFNDLMTAIEKMTSFKNYVICFKDLCFSHRRLAKIRSAILTKNVSSKIHVVHNYIEHDNSLTALETCEEFNIKLVRVSNCALSHAYLSRHERELPKLRRETNHFLKEITTKSGLQISSQQRADAVESRKIHSSHLPTTDLITIPTQNKFALLSTDDENDRDMHFSSKQHSHQYQKNQVLQHKNAPSILPPLIRLYPNKHDRTPTKTLFSSRSYRHQDQKNHTFWHKNANSVTLTPLNRNSSGQNQNHTYTPLPSPGPSHQGHNNHALLHKKIPCQSQNSKNTSVSPISESQIYTRVSDSMKNLQRASQLELITTRADGHCLLYAVMNHLTSEPGNQWNYDSLKNALLTESQKNKVQYKNFIEKEHGDLTKMMEQYIAKKIFDHAAGDLIPQIISNVTGKPINIFNETDGAVWKTTIHPTTKNQPTNSQPIMIHRNNDHYSGLRDTTHNFHNEATTST